MFDLFWIVKAFIKIAMNFGVNKIREKKRFNNKKAKNQLECHLADPIEQKESYFA